MDSAASSRADFRTKSTNSQLTQSMYVNDMQSAYDPVPAYHNDRATGYGYSGMVLQQGDCVRHPFTDISANRRPLYDNRWRYGGH